MPNEKSRVIAISAVLLGLHCLFACTTRETTRDVLKKQLTDHKRIAVVQMDIHMASPRGMGELLEESMVGLINKTGLLNKELASSRAAFQTQLEEHAISLANQQLSVRGLLPIQRKQIQAIVKEQALSQSGLVGNPLRLGKLLSADSIFTGRITIQENKGLPFVPESCSCLLPEDLQNRTLLIFSAEITSTESSLVLYSNSEQIETKRLKMNDLQKLILLWFESIPEI